MSCSACQRYADWSRRVGAALALSGCATASEACRKLVVAPLVGTAARVCCTTSRTVTRVSEISFEPDDIPLGGLKARGGGKPPHDASGKVSGMISSRSILVFK